ncbi:ABC transporter ATP-binding protein [Bacillus wiedmannii]|uniref:ABC transporter ATP-binding protein n=1 Tax=Bacillus wiedmannii TaxID=1890302 RepID=UPI000D08AD3D|nr:ABC transporter ATP-binding protein [Bacillus wiedmannii]PRT15843.1 ABC transporter [Bacillus wiedmannii]
MIQINNVNKTYKRKRILNNVTLNIEGVYGLIGPNGAGKTTLMRAIAGLITIDSGEINLFPQTLDQNTKKNERNSIGYLPQEFSIYPKITIWECLNHLAILKGISDTIMREKMVNDILEKVNLQQHKSKKIKELSGGMKKRVGIAQMLIGKPDILIIDEPTAGLDIEERIRFRNLILSLSKDKIIIISSHIVEDVEFLCNKIGILKQGEVIAEGSPSQIAAYAKGKVWEKKISLNEIDYLFEQYNVLDINQVDSNYYYAKILSDVCPPNAIQIAPKIIDGYLSVIHEKVVL